MHCKDSVWYGVWLREGPGCLHLNRGSPHDFWQVSVSTSPKWGRQGLPPRAIERIKWYVGNKMQRSGQVLKSSVRSKMVAANSNMYVCMQGAITPVRQLRAEGIASEPQTRKRLNREGWEASMGSHGSRPRVV